MTDRADHPPAARLARWAPALLLPLLLLAYHLLFGRHFPSAAGTLGADYALTLPALLAGAWWFRASGPLAVPWFTPAFCGGQPFFADAQSAYYALPQALALRGDPLTACYATMLAFAAAGYAGTYLLVRRRFGAGRAPAALAATVFMFNGFFAARMMVGHVGFHGFMLTPGLAYGLLGPAARPDGAAGAPPGAVVRGALTGIAAAYCVHSGLASLLVPVALAAGALVLLRAARGGLGVRALLARGAVAAATALALSASKLVAALSFMASFPRSDYRLPGYRTLLDAAQVAWLALFVSPADLERRSAAVLANAQWELGGHELDYGVTAVPLAALAIAAAALARDLARGRLARPRPARAALWAALGLALLLPVALNTYAPGWNALLKATPVLKSSSTLVRWFLVYVALAAVAAGLALERLAPRWRAPLAAAGIAAVVALSFARGWTAPGPAYAPGPVARAHRAAAVTGVVPAVARIAGSVGPDGRLVQLANGNDLLTAGESPLACYNPSFGYRLEHLPIGALHPGSVWEARDGRLNLKNPACYVFPAENGCAPGDHFLAAQRPEAERFVRYEPFEFERSRAQAIADAVTAAGLAAALAVLVAAAWRALRRARPERTP